VASRRAARALDATFEDVSTGATCPADVRTWRTAEGRPLTPRLPVFDPAAVVAGNHGLWRYRALLPLPAGARPVALGEGWTPLLPVSMLGWTVHLKLEYLQPTGSYKDRGSAVLASALSAAGVVEAVEDSSGNAAASLAAYLGHLGIALRVFVPEHTPRPRLRQIEACGAQVDQQARTRAEATVRAQDAVASGSVYASHVHSPYFMAGQATMAYEIWEQLGGHVPENVVVPVGHGVLLLGLYHGFSALQRAGLIVRVPRLFGVQARPCAPIYEAFARGAAETCAVVPGPTSAAGIRVEDPPRGAEVLAAVRATGGTIVALGDEEILQGQLLVAQMGWFVEAASAAAIAGLLKLDRLIPAQGSIVIPLTGSGLKT
jgi:threonine synthase